ncbi:hypothetical protein CR513_10820, partial [Mucuna pruriens]
MDLNCVLPSSTNPAWAHACKTEIKPAIIEFHEISLFHVGDLNITADHSIPRASIPLHHPIKEFPGRNYVSCFHIAHHHRIPRYHISPESPLTLINITLIIWYSIKKAPSFVHLASLAITRNQGVISMNKIILPIIPNFTFTQNPSSHIQFTISNKPGNKGTKRGRITLRHHLEKTNSRLHITIQQEPSNQSIGGHNIPLRHGIEELQSLVHPAILSIATDDRVPRDTISLGHQIKQLSSFLNKPTSTTGKVTRNNEVPGHDVPLGHFIKQLARLGNLSPMHIPSNHGVPGNGVSVLHGIEECPRFV